MILNNSIKMNVSISWRFRHPRSIGNIARIKLNELVSHDRDKINTSLSNAVQPYRKVPLSLQNAVASKSYRRRISTLSGWILSHYLLRAVAQLFVSTSLIFLIKLFRENNWYNEDNFRIKNNTRLFYIVENFAGVSTCMQTSWKKYII